MHYEHRPSHSFVPTPKVAIENDIDMMVICTCSRRWRLEAPLLMLRPSFAFSMLPPTSTSFFESALCSLYRPTSFIVLKAPDKTQRVRQKRLRGGVRHLRPA